MTDNHTTVDVCNSQTEAEHVIRQLQAAGFDMKKLSIVGKSHHDPKTIIGYYNTGDRMRLWGKTGAFWGGLWEILHGSAFFIIPEIGPILAAGPLVAAVIGAVEQTVTVGSLNAFGVSLYNLGIPQNSIRNYEKALTQGKFLVIAQGTKEEVAKARDLLGAGLAQ